MKNLLVSLILFAAGVGFFAAAQRVRSARVERPTPRVVDLFEGQADSLGFAAVGLKVPATGEEFLYVRAEGRWRCHTAFLAPTLDGLVPDLVENLLASRGVVRSSDGPAHASYGLDPPRYRIALRGPKALSDPNGDELAVIEVGHTLADGNSSPVTFVRRAGDERVFELALDLRATLDRQPGNTMPPMLDERLVPGAWPGRGGAFRHVRIEGSHGVISLVRRDLEPSAEQPGQQRWEWLIQSPDHPTQPASFERVETFCAFLMVVGYIGLEDPARASEYVSDPSVVLLAMPLEGEPVELYLGDEAPRVRGSFCLNRGARLLAVAARDVARALDPEPNLFVDPTTPDPWLPFLGSR